MVLNHRISILTLLSMCLLLPGRLQAGASGTKILRDLGNEVLVRVDFDSASGDIKKGYPPFVEVQDKLRIHYKRFFVRIPQGSDYRVSFYGGEFEDRKEMLPALPSAGAINKGEAISSGRAFIPASPIEVSGPVYFRKVPLLMIDCYSVQLDPNNSIKRVWSDYKIKVTFSKKPSASADFVSDPFVSKVVVNGGKGKAPRRNSKTQISDPHFSLSSNWVKIEVSSRGMYMITGNDLFSRGVALGGIDPSSLRLFTAGGMAQSRSYTDTAGTWIPGNWMQECAIEVRDGSDGTFDPQDSLIFYGLEISDWMDYFDPQAPDTVFYDHPYAKKNVYFLTWNGNFAGAPLRMNVLDAFPGAGPYVSTYEERLYFERNIVKNFVFGGDGWLWLEVTRLSFPNEQKFFPSFKVNDLVTSSEQEFRTVAFSLYCGVVCSADSFNANSNHHAVYMINNIKAAEAIWNTSYGDNYDDALWVNGKGFFLTEGDNKLVLLIPRDLNAKDFMYFEWYSIFYQRYLKAISNELSISSPDTTGTITFKLQRFTGNDSVYVFDVTNQFNPQQLTGFSVTTDSTGSREVTFSSFITGRKKFWACTSNSFKKPFSMTRYPARDLRSPSINPNMLIICNKLFLSAAEELKRYRQSNLPYFPSAEVVVATSEEVFDNFSGGVVDPMAIRNYCKFLYDNFNTGGVPDLSYLLLLGDANTDYKNFASVQPDYVPTNLNLKPSGSSSSVAYATDDWFVLLDIQDENRSLAIPDVSVGRLPAGSSNEALNLVEKVTRYETSTGFNPWRNKVILVADDENSGTKSHTDDTFIIQSEILAKYHLPQYIDIFKIYLTEFPSIGGTKPGSRKTLLDNWNSGALLINYIGHGSSQQMADEHVFLGSDVGLLNNGNRLPLLVALSCTIGDFDNPSAKSLSEKLLLRENGGVCAAVTATEVTYVTPNFNLNYNFFDSLFPSLPGYSEALGTALLLAKLYSLPVPSAFIVENNEKYNLLGDPASRIVIPKNSIEFLSSGADSLTAGTSERIMGRVMKAASVDSSFYGKAYLLARESDDTTGYRRVSDDFQIGYHYPGGVIYRGATDVKAGEFEFNIHIPRYPSPGAYSYLMAYAENGIADASMTKNDVKLLYPSPGDTTVGHPRDGKPRVNLGFKGGITVVKPGAILQAIVHDADGINTLSTTNEGKQVLLFDQTNIPVDVTEYFEYDHGGSDTSGVLQFPLSNISVGPHQVIYKVADTFGLIKKDTLGFTCIDSMMNYARVVLNYPNPFSESTHFLIHLSDPASIDLRIFTSSGKCIRTLEAAGVEGENWIFWDGRDFSMESIANGVYLYVVRVSFLHSEKAMETIRGKVVKIR